MIPDLMKSVSQDGTAGNNNVKVKTADLVLLLDGLRLDPSILSQSHEVLGEATNSRSPLNDGVRARIRLRNSSDSSRSMLRTQNLRVRFFYVYSVLM